MMFEKLCKNRRVVSALAMASLAFLTACNQTSRNDPLAGGGGLTGRWVAADNVFTADLQDGNFVATANDTGEQISTGRYIVVSASEVQLDWFGSITQQQNRANCQRPSVDVLNCTDQAGRSFTLRKLTGAA